MVDVAGPDSKMRKQHQLEIRIPLPRHLPPAQVVEALQTHVPVIKHQAYVTKYEPAPVPLEKITEDRFFLVDGTRIASYHVHERIALIPGIASKVINFPVTFQSIRGGVRCRADAPGGVTVWSEFTVQTKDEADWTLGSAAGSHGVFLVEKSGIGQGENYVLVERVTVETNTLLLPFVAKSMEGAHRDICNKVLDEIASKFHW